MTFLDPDHQPTVHLGPDIQGSGRRPGRDRVARGFWTLLGPDFAGKSTVLSRLRDEYGWHVVSYDDRYLHDRPLIRKLRENWVAEGFASAGQRYSNEVVLSVLNTIVLYLRDEVAAATGPEPVIVDSYYYKLLVKCSLLGLEHKPTFDSWRELPRPGGVVYLDLPPELAWERSVRGRGANAFEYAGSSPGRAGFISLQSALRPALLAELDDVPVRVLDAAQEPDKVVAAVLDAMDVDDRPAG